MPFLPPPVTFLSWDLNPRLTTCKSCILTIKPWTALILGQNINCGHLHEHLPVYYQGGGCIFKLWCPYSLVGTFIIPTLKPCIGIGGGELLKSHTKQKLCPHKLANSWFVDHDSLCNQLCSQLNWLFGKWWGEINSRFLLLCSPHLPALSASHLATNEVALTYLLYLFLLVLTAGNLLSLDLLCLVILLLWRTCFHTVWDKKTLGF